MLSDPNPRQNFRMPKEFSVLYFSFEDVIIRANRIVQTNSNITLHYRCSCLTISHWLLSIIIILFIHCNYFKPDINKIQATIWLPLDTSTYFLVSAFRMFIFDSLSSHLPTNNILSSLQKRKITSVKGCKCMTNYFRDFHLSMPKVRTWKSRRWLFLLNASHKLLNFCKNTFENIWIHRYQ